MLWEHRLSNRFNAVADCPLALAGNDRTGSMYLAPVRASDTYVQEHIPARQHVTHSTHGRARCAGTRSSPTSSGRRRRLTARAIPLVVGTTVYDGSAIAPIVTAFDLRSGRVKWQLRVGGPVKGGIVERDGAVYFGDLKGTLWR